jgi:Protein of unknown function (DUF1566)
VALLALASLARADTDAPPDQYNLFNLNSEVIQDEWTLLVWQRLAPSTPTTLYDAEVYCSTLMLPTGTGASTGWRVPSYKELMTIVDETPHVEYEGGQLITKWIDGDAFPQATVTPGYWTSSMFPGEPGYAYTVDFHSGIPLQQDATSPSGLVRCVH